MSKAYSVAFVLLTAIAGACGSDDPITAIDRSVDCSDICGRYQDCIDSDYDVDACISECNDMVNEEDTQAIDDCEDCLDGEACTDSVFQCTSECAGIVP